MFVTPVTFEEIIGIVKHFNSKLSYGYDEVSMFMIKNVIRV